MDVNPWVRVNIEQTNPDTRELIIDYQQAEYDAILEEKMAASIALNSILGLIPGAQQRVARATQAQQAFFHKQQTEGTI